MGENGGFYLEEFERTLQVYYASELPKIKDSDKLDKALSEMNFGLVVSYTTRPKREGEVNGREHYFISEKEADDLLLDQTKIAAFTRIGDYRYFTTWEEVDKKNIYIIDPKGIEDFLCRQLMYRKQRRKIILLYIKTGDMVRYLRARKRPGFNKHVYKDRVESENLQFYEFDDMVRDCYQSEFYAYVDGSMYIINNNRGMSSTMYQINRVLLDTYKDNNNILYLVVGRSCSGKDTICKEIIDEVERKKKMYEV